MSVIDGTRFDDELHDTAANDTINGGAGNDSLESHLGGIDYLYGGDGDDVFFVYSRGSVVRLFGGTGEDEFYGGEGKDLIFGGDDHDSFGLTSGNDTIYGGAGTDSILFYRALKGVSFTLTSSGAGTIVGTQALGFTGTTTYAGMEALEGSGYNDRLTGNLHDNFLFGSEGDDILRGMDGRDVLIGSIGHDTLTGGAGGDFFAFYGETDRAAWKASRDAITDFDPRFDTMAFSSRYFTGLTNTADDAGATAAGWRFFNVQPSQFVSQTGSVATSTAVRLIYDRDDGLLYYDADGALSGFRPILIAELTANLALTASDFAIF